MGLSQGLATPSLTSSHYLPAQTFGAQVPVKRAMLSETPAALVAFEGLLAGVVPHMPHQGALLPEASATELAHMWLLLQVCSEVHLLGILRRPVYASLTLATTSQGSPHPPLGLSSRVSRLG